MELTRKNPWRHSFVKAGIPNLDPIFSSGFPYSWFDQSPFSAMRTKPGINHPWVYSAISTIVSSYVQCPLRLFNKRDPKKELIDDHPILKLLARPNPHLSGTNFLEAIVWNLDLSTRRTQGGQCFIWGDDCNFRKGEIPDELWLQTDEGVKPVLNDQEILQGWEFDFQKGVSPYNYGRGMKLDLQSVIRVNYFNPYNNLGGVAPGYAVRVGIDQDSRAQELNSAMIANGGQARGVYTSKKPMNPEQFTEFRKNLEKYAGGTENAGKDRFLPWEMEYNQLSLSPEDMKYLETMGWNRDSVMAAFKVSKFALQQYEDLNYATAKEAKRQLFDQAILPMNQVIMQELNYGWMDNVQRGDLQLTVDLSKVTALHDDLDARWKRADLAVQMGIPPMIALKMNEIPVDDLKAFPWLMENQSPNAAFAAAPADEKDPNAEKGFDPLKKKALSPADRRSLSQDHINKVRIPGEREVTLVLRRFYVGQRNRTQDLIDGWASTAVSVKAAGLDLFKLNTPKEDNALRSVMLKCYQATAKRSLGWTRAQIASVTKTLKADDGPDVQTQADIQTFITERLKTLSIVNNTSFKRVEEKVAEVLAQAIADELSIADVAKRLKTEVADVYAGRSAEALTVAMTETGTVSSGVQHIAMVDAGVEWKGWLASHVEDFRPEHQADEDNGPIPYANVFPNSGLHYPLEAGAPAKQVINCHCCFIAEPGPREA